MILLRLPRDGRMLKMEPGGILTAFATSRAAASPQSLPANVMLVGLPSLSTPFGDHDSRVPGHIGRDEVSLIERGRDIDIDF